MSKIVRKGKCGKRTEGSRRKSRAKHVEEQLRLKQAIALQDGGNAIKQIAAQLSVSEQTVKRDLTKARRHIEDRQKLQLRYFSEGRWKDFLSKFKV